MDPGAVGFQVGRAWRWFGNVAAVSAVALAIAWALVSYFKHDGPVVVAGPVAVKTPQVHLGGVLAFELEWFQRFESCPGTVVESFYPADDRSIAIVKRRPALSFVAKRYDRTPVNIQIPPELTIGRWRYAQHVESRECPSGRTGPDPFVEFVFEVIP